MNYKLEDLVDIQLLQELQEKLNAIYSFPSAIIDNDGRILTAVAWQDICTKFHRIHKESEKECLKSDQYILEHLKEANPAVSYRCPHGLVDNAAPIIIEGKHLANFFTGQFFLDKPDLDFFKKQAANYGFDEKTYLEAVEKVPIWTEDKLNDYLDFIKGFIEIIAGIGLNNLKEIENNKKIKESEERYRAIIQSTSDWVWEIDNDWNYTYCSHKIYNILGYSPEEIIGKSPFDLMPESESKKIKSDFAEIYDARASIVDMENWNFHKNGSLVCLLTSGFPIYDEKGNIKGYRGADKDITEKKLAEQALRENEEKYRLLHENAGIGIGYYKPDGTVISYNKIAAANMYGKPEDFTGKSLFDLFPKEDAYRYFDRIQKAALNNEPDVYEDYVSLPTGEKYFISTFTKITDLNNIVIGIQVISQDITEQKNIEIALRKSEEMFKSFIHNSIDVTTLTDINDNLLFCSPQINDLLGKIDNVEIGKKLKYDIHPEDAEKCRITWNLLKTNGKEIRNFEYRIFDYNGNMKWVSHTAKQVILEGNVLGIQSTVRDITDRKNTVEALKISEEKYRNIFENVQDVFYQTNLDGIIIDISPSSKYFSEINRDELIGKPVHSIYYDPKDRFLLVNEIMKTGELRDYEIKLKTNSDIVRYASVNARLIFDENGNPSHINGALRDITQRKNAEEELKLERRRLNDILKGTNAGTWEWNIQTGETVFNDKWAEIIGYTLEELSPINIGTWIKLTHPEDLILAQELIENHFKGEIEYYETEFRMQHKNGDWVWVLDRGRVHEWDEEGKPLLMAGTHMDITKRKNAEIAFKNRERYLHTVIHTSIDGFWVIDSSAKFIEANEAYCAMSGYSHDEILSLKINDIDINESPEDTINRINRIIKKGSELFETVHKRKDGTTFPVEVAVRFLNEDGGKFVCFCRDLTQRKRDEEYLAMLAQMLDEAPASITIHETNGNFLFANLKTFSMHGYSKEEFMKINLCELDLPESLALQKERFEKIEKYGEASFEVEHYHKDGSTFPLQIIAKKISWHGIPAILSIGSDIAERRKAEEAIQKSYEMLHNLTAQVPGVVYQYRLYPDGRSAFPYSSPGMYNIYEVTPEEVSEDASLVFTRLHPDDIDYIVDTIYYSAEHLTLYHSEFRVILPEQGLRWRLCNAKPMRMNDGGTLWYGIISDITDRKNSEMLLQEQNQRLEAQYEEYMQLNEVLRKTNYDLELAKTKAEESDKLKTAFLQNMSHEIRTPLNGILGFSDLLKDENISKAEIKEFSEVIQQSGHRLLEIVNNVLDISKIETGQLDIYTKPFSLNSLLSDIYTFFLHKATEKGLKLYNHKYFDDDNCIIENDDIKLNQILINLINNAIKFTESGRIDFGYELIEDNLRFFVNDTGIGISKEHYEVIFDRFSQIDFSLSRGYEGAGLGLAISKGLVELLGGKIWLESEPDKGTAFYFTIPYNTSKHIEINTDSNYELPLSHNKYKLLIAEDDFISFKYLNQLLTKEKFTIYHVDNGQKAIDFVYNNPDVHIIFMDIKMPVMDGIEATKQIKDIKPDIPIIAQTAYAFIEEKNNILAAGCDDYLSKPIERDKLFRILNKYLS